MKTARQKIISGIICCLMGLFYFGVLIFALIRSFQNNDIDYKVIIFLFFGFLFSVMIILCGVSDFKTAYRDYVTAYRDYGQKQLVLSKGKAYWGKIKEYIYGNDNDNTGKYPLILRVRYLNDNGEIREINIPTYKYEQSEFPITYNVQFKIYKDSVVLVGAATTQKIQGEDELLLDGMDVKGNLPTVTVSCPNCGGEVKIPVGSGAKCAYCGMILRTDRYGKLIKTR